jgi:hypothetical protein
LVLMLMEDRFLWKGKIGSYGNVRLVLMGM